MRSRWHYLIITLLLYSCSAEDDPKNFVFILVDDLGWSDLGFMGNDFHETPNIDSFSKECIVFNNAYSSGSVCSPSRAAIMTGKYPARLQITDWIPGADPQNQALVGPKDKNELPLAETTFSEILSQHGYATHFAGKWHLGGDGFHPVNQGFDENLGGNHTGQPKGGYYSPYDNPQLSDGPPGEYLTDRLTNEVLRFISDRARDKQPFLTFLSYYTVHTPIQAGPHIDLFTDKLNLMSDTVKTTTRKDYQTTQNHRNPEYASMVYSLDENIGKIISSLKKKKLYDKSTIIFTSDNGGLSTLLSRYERVAPTSVLPLRGGKGWLYEGGIRVPLLIKPAYYRGPRQKIETPVIGHDLFHTILSLSGIPLSDTNAEDGVDLSALWQQQPWHRESLYWHYPHYHGSGWRPGSAIRKGKWKLIWFYESNHIELYDLKNDIGEQTELSETYPGIAAELKQQLTNWQQTVGAQQSVQNTNLKTEGQ